MWQLDYFPEGIRIFSEHLLPQLYVKWLYFWVEQNSAVIPTSCIMKGQLINSEVTCHFGSYPLCRMLWRFYAQLNNLGKTQGRLKLTLLMIYWLFIPGNFMWLHFLKHSGQKLNSTRMGLHIVRHCIQNVVAMVIDPPSPQPPHLSSFSFFFYDNRDELGTWLPYLEIKS